MKYLNMILAVLLVGIVAAHAAQKVTFSDREVRDPKQLAPALEANAADAESRIAAVEAAGVGGALASGKIIVGNSGGTGAAVTVTGDITLSNEGVAAIASGANVDADINTNALIAVTKLSTEGQASLALADTALQPDGNLTGSMGTSTTAVDTVVSGAALGTTSLQPNAVAVTNVIVGVGDVTNTIVIIGGQVISWTVEE
jgi:hypothetical protein